jgi:hypothetical protein
MHTGTAVAHFSDFVEKPTYERCLSQLGCHNAFVLIDYRPCPRQELIGLYA